MPAIPNPKHEAYCHAIVTGEAGAVAYKRLISAKGTKQSSAEVGSCQLQKRPHIAARILELREMLAKRAEEQTFLTIEEKRRHCARVFRAKGAALDVHGADADLIQGVTYTKDGRAVYSIMSKAEALKLDNDLAVDGAEASANKALEIVIRRL